MEDERKPLTIASIHSRRHMLQTAVGGISAAALAVGGGLTMHSVLASDEDDDGDNSGSGSSGDDHDDNDDESVEVTEEIPEGSIEIRIVSEDADGFQPNDLTVDLGQSVTFVNAHDDEHTATGSGFDTGEIERGETATIVLDEPGRFAYACNFHPEMTGTIRVRDEDGNVPESSAQTGEVPADAIEVQIVSFAFEPATVTIAAGGTVVWINNDSAPHTVTGLNGEFDSDILDPGSSFAWQFTEPGNVSYECSLHPAMQGTIEVTGEAVVDEDGAAAALEPAGIVGAWIVSVEPAATHALPPQRALTTFHEDGAVMATFASVEDGFEGRLSDAHGTWEAAGDGAIAATIAAMSLGSDGAYAGIITITADISLDESGDGFSGEVSFAATGEDEESTASGQGMIEGQRVGSSETTNDELDASPVAGANGASATTVTIVNFAFDPVEIDVTAGSTVTWVNEDAAPHTATADDASFDTGRLDQGADGSATFDKPGTYAYQCDFHPAMVGTVTVT